MNQELLQLYIKGLLQGCFAEDHKTYLNFEGIHKMYTIEKYGNTDRTANPEFIAALELMNSPLVKALE